MPSAVRGSIAALPTIGVVQATLGRGNIFVGKLFSRRYMCLPNDFLKFSVRHLFKVFVLSNILVLEPRGHHRCGGAVSFCYSSTTTMSGASRSLAVWSSQQAQSS